VRTLYAKLTAKSIGVFAPHQAGKPNDLKALMYPSAHYGFAWQPGTQRYQAAAGR